MALHCQTRNRENKDKETKSLKKKVFFSNDRKDGLHNQKNNRKKKFDDTMKSKDVIFLSYFSLRGK